MKKVNQKSDDSSNTCSTLVNRYSYVQVDYTKEERKLPLLLIMQSYLKSINKFRLNLFDRFPLLIYSLKRILFGLITLTLAIAVVFILLRTYTPDSVYLGDVDISKLNITPNSKEYNQLLEQRMKMFGVYGSIWTQLGNYFLNLIPFVKKTIIVNSTIDIFNKEIINETKESWFYLGTVFSASIAQPGEQVSDVISRAIPYSLGFGVVSILIAYLLGVPLGIISARYKERPADNIINTVTITLLAIPALIIVICVYYVSIYLFRAHGLFETGGFSTLFWPTFTIVLLIMPFIILNTRRYVIDEMTSDYAKFALAKGMSKRYVFYVHIFRIAGIRIIRILPIYLTLAVFGLSVIVETNWQVPGMARLIIAGVTNKDIFVVMAYLVLSASAGIVASLTADILLAVLDPRVKLAE